MKGRVPDVFAQRQNSTNIDDDEEWEGLARGVDAKVIVGEQCWLF